MGDDGGLFLRQRVLAAGGLPLPGRGDTLARLRGLEALGRGDLSLARLSEGHADAVAVLADAGRRAVASQVYGVWASVSGASDVQAARGEGGWLLQGTKQFCSGAALCDRALVRARCGQDDLLFEVDLRAGGVEALEGTWPAVGMQGSDSRAVRFEGVAVPDHAVVGAPGSYAGRPGFWHGGVGVAAVWAGAAAAVVATTAAALPGGAGDAELSLLGGAVAALEAMEALIERAARAIDADPEDRAGQARRLALATRHAVHAGAVSVLAATAGAGGARPLSLDPDNARRVADLHVYLAQHHPGRDGAALGRMAAGTGPG